MSGSVLIAAGGTGGHMFPAEALAQELVARGRAVALVTDRRGAQYATRPGSYWSTLPVHVVSAATPAGKNPFGMATAFADIARGVFAARTLLRRLKPDAVVGFGGYPSLPPMIAARLEGIPTVLHEQNAVLGKVNRLIAPRVRALALSHPRTRFLATSQSAPVVTGNPVRPGIAGLRDAAYAEPTEVVHVLVVGGSQGAAVLSQVVPAALASLPEALRRRLFVTQQARADSAEAVELTLRTAGIAHEVAPFFDDMAEKLRRTHLVISRAGASTVSELACAGRPSILVPLPGAAEDHQTFNAAALVVAGGAQSIAQSEFTPVRLAAILSILLNDGEALRAMAEAARSCGRADAEVQLADLVERFLPANGNRHTIATNVDATAAPSEANNSGAESTAATTARAA